MNVEKIVADHYAHGTLLHAIDAALAASGKDPEHIVLADLSPIDEFHIGGRPATIAFADQLGLGAGMHLLDVGSGLGGPSRHFAEARGCRVTGIDLTRDYVEAAAALAARVGLADRVSYRQGSATDLPFEDGSFDAATLMHVGMNIADKACLFREVRRVLKPGAVFGIYDVMREGEGELAYPVPWAATAETSFVETSDTYVRLLEAAGFAIAARRSRRDFALESMREQRARMTAAGGPPPLGLQIVLGPTAPQKTANILANMERGVVAPTEIVSRAA